MSFKIFEFQTTLGSIIFSVGELLFTPKNDIEKIIRIIPIQDNDKFKSNKLELGIITINLSNIRSPDGHSYIKIFLKQVKYQLNTCFLI